MTSVCISNCVNDTRDPRIPVRATYVNLYKWPESDAEFVRSVSSKPRRSSAAAVPHWHHNHPRVVDSISCRQMYLRSYTFTRKETVPEKTQKCFGRVKKKMVNHNDDDDDDDDDEKKRKKKQKNKKKKGKGRGSKGSKCLVLRKVKEFSSAALFRIFQRLLSCSASVDVMNHDQD